MQTSQNADGACGAMRMGLLVVVSSSRAMRVVATPHRALRCWSASSHGAGRALFSRSSCHVSLQSPLAHPIRRQFAAMRTKGAGHIRQRQAVHARATILPEARCSDASYWLLSLSVARDYSDGCHLCGRAKPVIPARRDGPPNTRRSRRTVKRNVPISPSVITATVAPVAIG